MFVCVCLGKNGELLPTTEEAEELVRALQAMDSYPDSLVCLTSMGDLASSEAVDHRSMAVFPGPVQTGGMGDLLSSRINTENFTSLELEENLLQSADDAHFPPSPPSQSVSRPSAASSSFVVAVPPTAAALLTQTSAAERTFPRAHASIVLAKSDGLASSTSSPSQGGRYGSEHVPSPYSDNISSPHAAPFQADAPLLLEVSLSGVPETPPPPRSSWSSSLPLPLADPAHFGNLMGAESHLHVSTSLSTPPATTTHSVTLQPMAAPSASSRDLLTSSSTCSSSSSSSAQPKQQLPQFSAAFGHQLASHSGIPKDVQPSHSSTAPPAGFSAVSSAAAASANSAAPPFAQK